VAAQLWDRILRDIPDLSEKLHQAEFGEILTWLRENIHCHGTKYSAQEVLHNLTGSGIDSNPYMHYLDEKFGKIYGF
ncbi:MAG: carboxypeptidase M32, partial [Anaerolineales bacterium]|nr:carboxypeptidase M32 [Anaerolineales bacterium]